MFKIVDTILFFNSMCDVKVFCFKKTKKETLCFCHCHSASFERNGKKKCCRALCIKWFRRVCSTNGKTFNKNKHNRMHIAHCINWIIFRHKHEIMKPQAVTTFDWDSRVCMVFFWCKIAYPVLSKLLISF